MGLVHYTLIIGFLIGIVLFFRLPKLKKTAGMDFSQHISVSVIIPARNEENNLPGILTDLEKQTYRIHEIICVDDNSEDATRDVIKRFGIKCVSLEGKASGWKGKTWACQKGAQAATGQLLIFIDADVRLSKNAVESLVNRHLKCKKPVSVQPYHTVKKQYEYFSMFFNLIPICATGLSFPGLRKTTGLFGPVLLIPTEIFNKYKGYEKVKNSVVEDLYLGKYYNKNGVDADLKLGGRDIEFRMYPNSFAEVFEGWSKNFSTASLMIRWWMLVIIFAWVTFLTALPIEITKSAINGEFAILIFKGALYVLTTLVLYRAASNIGSYPWFVCFLYPIYLMAFHLIFVYSFFATFITKTTTWKGRRL